MRASSGVFILESVCRETSFPIPLSGFNPGLLIPPADILGLQVPTQSLGNPSLPPSLPAQGPQGREEATGYSYAKTKTTDRY